MEMHLKHRKSKEKQVEGVWKTKNLTNKNLLNVKHRPAAQRHKSLALVTLLLVPTLAQAMNTTMVRSRLLK